MKSDSLENLKNQLEQLKTNLKQASSEGDQEEVKFWSKQIRLTELVLKRLQDIQSKKSGKK